MWWLKRKNALWDTPLPYTHSHSSQQQLYVRVCDKTLSEVSLTVNWYHTKTFLWCWLQTFWTLWQSWCILYKEVKGVLEVCQVWCIRMRVDGLYSTHNKEWGTMPSTQHVQSNNSTYNSFKNDTGQSAYQSSFRSRFLVSFVFVRFFSSGQSGKHFVIEISDQRVFFRGCKNSFRFRILIFWRFYWDIVSKKLKKISVFI